MVAGVPYKGKENEIKVWGLGPPSPPQPPYFSVGIHKEKTSGLDSVGLNRPINTYKVSLPSLLEYDRFSKNNKSSIYKILDIVK